MCRCAVGGEDACESASAGCCDVTFYNYYCIFRNEYRVLLINNKTESNYSTQKDSSYRVSDNDKVFSYK